MGRQGSCEQGCSNGARYTGLVLVASYGNREIIKINVSFENCVSAPYVFSWS